MKPRFFKTLLQFPRSPRLLLRILFTTTTRFHNHLNYGFENVVYHSTCLKILGDYKIGLFIEFVIFNMNSNNLLVSMKTIKIINHKMTCTKIYIKTVTINVHLGNWYGVAWKETVLNV